MANIIDKIKLKIIIICHLFIILFIILAPFSNSNYILFLHSIIIPLIVMHWILNNDVCSLTLMEKKIREKLYGKQNISKCFTCKIIEPVYNFKDNHKKYDKLLYVVVSILWIISIYKLYYKYKIGEIKSIVDLFII